MSTQRVALWSLSHAINLTEAGVLYEDFAHTATNSDGTFFGNFGCSDYTSGSSSLGALVGYSIRTDAQWSLLGVINCAIPKALYCFEQ